MIEEILKSINENLKRIADIEESKVGKTTTDNAVNPIQVEDIAKATIVPLNQIPVAIPSEPVIKETVIPVTNTIESFTHEQLALAMSNAVSAGKINIIKGILARFNVQALTEIKPEDYNKLATLLKEAGVEI